MLWAVILLPGVCTAQLEKESFEQLDSLQKIETRPVVVFIHTDWCKFCKMMEQTTFQNDSVVNLLNEKFYFISLDAESKQDITFQGHTFKFKPSGHNTGTHELALELGSIKGKPSYPTLCFLNKKHEIIYQVPNFKDSDEMKRLLKLILKV